MAILISLSIIPIIIKFMLGDIDENKRNKKIFYIICGICIFLVMGLRDKTTGTEDTSVYYSLLETISSDISLSEYLKSRNPDETFFLFAEHGFSTFVWILGRLKLDPQSLIIASSLIISSCVMVFFYRHSKDSLVSVLMFICLGSFTFAMNGMRQAMAMSICLLSYAFVEKRKIIPFILTILLATMFHKTALIFSVAYLINFIKPKLSNMVIFVAALLIFFVFQDNLIEIFDEVANKDYSDGESLDGGGIITVLIYIGGIVLYFLGIKKFNDNNLLPLLMLGIVGLYLYLCRYFAIQMFERLSYYFYYSIPILVAAEFSQIEKTERRIVTIMFTILCLALFAYRLSNGDFSEFKFFF